MTTSPRPKERGNAANSCRESTGLLQPEDMAHGHHHGVGRKHLPHYLNEFVFRFNRRRTPMAAFQTLLGLAGQHTPTTYKMLYGGESTG